MSDLAHFIGKALTIPVMVFFVVLTLITLALVFPSCSGVAIILSALAAWIGFVNLVS